ncbi:MAG: hypothetical protein ACRDRJ_11650 [Streptosporangiaceae bacterium]
MTQVSGQPVSAAVRQLAGLVEVAGRGLTAAELIAAAQSRFPGQHPRRIGGLIEQALRARALVQDGALLRMPEPFPAEAATPAVRRPVRAVVVDLESVVRPSAAEPYIDKRIFQIGAVRMGTDSAWTAAQPTFGRFLELPDGAWEIRSDQLHDRHQDEAIPAAEGLSALHDMCSGADMLVAYNGAEADFPLLAQAYEREQMPTLDPVPVDAYYLALALWPAAASHRLAVLADALGVNGDGLSWHDAVDDCILLQRLLEHAGHLLAGWDEALVDLAASVCPDSPAWTLLRHLAGQARGLEPGHALGATVPRVAAEVSAVLSAHLSGHTPRRHPAGTSAARGAIQVGAMLRGPDGRVDPVLLAAIAHGSDARRRAAQEEMTSALHRWADAGVPALIEAPTGTGKSFAVLAAALDWLAGAPERTAIVTTFTKQLQQQLADDVARLDAVIPGLLDTSEVVKGQSNRLSLRALTAALADSTTETAPNAPAQGGRNRFLARPQFRELLVFLVLRLLAAADAQASWAAHSVDPVDVPPFFAGYAGPVLPVWLESLSQASNGEYPAGAATPLASHTDAVREALAAHRLLIANHALLLAHLDDLDALGPDTLLIVDEAHQLEDAATGALTSAVDYRAVEDLFAELDVWARSARPGTARESVREAAGNLGILLDHEHLPRVAGMAFDARGTGAGVVVGSRTVTLASAYAGTAGVPEVRQLAALLVRLGGQCEALVGALGSYYTTHQASLDFFAAERCRRCWPGARRSGTQHSRSWPTWTPSSARPAATARSSRPWHTTAEARRTGRRAKIRTASFHLGRRSRTIPASRTIPKGPPGATAAPCSESCQRAHPTGLCTQRNWACCARDCGGTGSASRAVRSSWPPTRPGSSSWERSPGLTTSARRSGYPGGGSSSRPGSACSPASPRWRSAPRSGWASRPSSSASRTSRHGLSSLTVP